MALVITKHKSKSSTSWQWVSNSAKGVLWISKNAEGLKDWEERLMVQCKLLSNKKTLTKHFVISEVLSPSVLIIHQVPIHLLLSISRKWTADSMSHICKRILKGYYIRCYNSILYYIINQLLLPAKIQPHPLSLSLSLISLPFSDWSCLRK